MADARGSGACRRNRNCHRIRSLTAHLVACYACAELRCPSGATSRPLSGGLRLRTLGILRPCAAQAQGDAAGSLGPARSTPTSSSSSLSGQSGRRKVVLADPAALLARCPGRSFFYKLWQFRRAAAADRDVPRRLPQEQQVLRGAGGLSRRCRRVRSSGCSRPATPSSTRSCASDESRRRPSQPAAAGRPTLKSLDAVDRALLRATTVEIDQARAAACRFWRRPRASRRSSGCSARCGAS